jgi:integrin beta 3
MPGHEGAAGAPGSAGERGIQGEVGPKGDQGERGANAPPLTKDQIVDALATMTETLEAFVVKHLTAHPPPAGSDGAAGAAGRDGVGLAGALLNHKGELVLTLSDGTIRELGLVVGRDGAKGADGADGKDGADGLGFDDLQDDLEDGGRVIVRRYSRGEQVKEFRHRTALTIYRNVWKDGTAYERGDVVSYGGSTWHANEQTTARPGGTAAAARAWTLMVKEGRQGKDGKGLQGPVGPAGPKGDPGNGRY